MTPNPLNPLAEARPNGKPSGLPPGEVYHPSGGLGALPSTRLTSIRWASELSEFKGSARMCNKIVIVAPDLMETAPNLPIGDQKCIAVFFAN